MWNVFITAQHVALWGKCMHTDTWRDFLHFDRQAQLISIPVRGTEGIWGDACVRCVSVSSLCVGVQAVCVSAGECKADRPSDRARRTRCAYILVRSVHTRTHTHTHTPITRPKCLKLRTSVTGSVDESSHRMLFLTFCFFFSSQVLKYLDYVFTGVFTFEMVIKVRRCQNESKLRFQLWTNSVSLIFGDLQVKNMKDSKLG